MDELTLSANYPYDQTGWFLSTQQYYCRMSKYGYKPSDPKYKYVFDTGKDAFIEGTTKRIFEQEYEDYKASISPY
jgi:hypothetical protein